MTGSPEPSGPATAGPDPDGAAPRQAWVDVAKGICIALVVLYHTSLWYMEKVSVDEWTFWSEVSAALAPLRMPLFFMVSGYLAASSLKRPFARLFPKTFGLYFLYLLWTALVAAKFFIPAARDGYPFPPVDRLLLTFVLPTNQWYIWALPLFYTLAWGLERAFGRFSVYALIPFALLALSSHSIDMVAEGIFDRPIVPCRIGSVAANLLWFYAGVKGGSIWLGMVARAGRLRCVAAVAAFLGAYVLASHFGLARELLTFLSCIALWAAAELLGLAPLTGPVGRTISIIGRGTLPIYLMHTWMLTILSPVAKALHVIPILRQHAVISDILVPPLVTLGIIVVTSLIGRIAARTPFRFVVEPLKDWPWARRRPAATPATAPAI